MKLLRTSVVTPSLNKSFKFQSDWPYNNSQVYLLSSIMEDLKEDEDREFKATNDGYYFSSSVNYPNNKALVNQKVYLDKNGSITKVEVVDKNDNVQISMKFTKQEFDKKFDKNYFELSNLLKMNKKDNAATDNKNKTEADTQTQERADSPKENNSSNNMKENQDTNTQNNNNSNNNTNNNATAENNTTNSNENSSNNSTTNQETNETKKTETTATIDDIVYPMYLPDNTYLTSQEKVDTKNGQRLILTFGGDSSFVLVEETVGYEEEGLVIPVSGEFDFLSDVIGVIGTNSVTWQSNGIEYYIASESIATAELVSIARSISILPVSK